MNNARGNPCDVLALVVFAALGTVACGGEGSADEALSSAELALSSANLRINAGDYTRHWDSDASNNGAQGSPQCNRGTDVDYWHNDAVGADGCHIGWTQPGEWLEYRFQVPEDGFYDIAVHLGSAFDAKKVRVSLYTGDQKGPQIQRTLFAENRGWGQFTPGYLRRQFLRAGPFNTQLLIVEHLTGELDFNGFNITKAVDTTRIEAESYFVASDNTPENSGNNPECPSALGVDLEWTGDFEGGRCNVGWGEAGEFLAWYVSPPASGDYRVVARVASAVGGRFTLEGSPEKFVYTGGWQEWQDLTVFDRIHVSGPGPWKPPAWTFRITQSGVNLNYIEFIPLF